MLHRLETIKEVLDRMQGDYEALVPPKPPKARKRDRRTLGRNQREKKNEARRTGRDKRLSDGQLKEQFHKLRREIQARAKKGLNGCFEWNLSLQEWLDMWSNCPAVEVAFNTFRPAWLARGKQKSDVQLKRIDTSKAYRKDNLLIMKGKTVLYPSV